VTYQDLLDGARRILDEILADLASGRPGFEVSQKLKAAPRADLVRARRLIDEQLAPSTTALPIEVIAGGMPFGEWLADDLDLDRAHRLLIFIEDYGRVTDELGYEPTIPELADATTQSVATINRRLADFRSALPGERNPARLARVLRQALNSEQLWSSLEESLKSSIRDVPVVGRSTASDQDRAVHALAQAADALNGTAVGSSSLYRFMAEHGMPLPANALVLETILRQAWRAGRIMRAPNGVYTPLNGSGQTEWDRPLTDYYAAAEHGFPLPGSWSRS
jgi:hypothetical protein